MLRILVTSAILTSPFAAAATDSGMRGQEIAERHCSICHAVGKTDNSPLPPAPPFRTFKDKWPVEVLAESLAEGIVTGHDEMPEFVLEPNDIEAFLTYLEQL